MTCCLHFGWYSHFTLFLDVSCSSGSLPLLCAPTDSLKVEVCSSVQLFMLHLILTNIHEDADGYTWLKTMKEIIWPGPACRTKSFLKCTSWSLDQLCISLWSASNLRPKRNPKPLTFSSKMLHQQAKKKNKKSYWAAFLPLHFDGTLYCSICLVFLHLITIPDCWNELLHWTNEIRSLKCLAVLFREVHIHRWVWISQHQGTACQRAVPEHRGLAGAADNNASIRVILD